MPTKNRTFYAYQIDMHYLDMNDKREFDAVKWDADSMGSIFRSIHELPAEQKTLRKKDSWFMTMEHFEESEHFFFGRIISADYGTVGDLVHADTLTSRANPKQIREGEAAYVYFIIKKIDGLLLLQSNLKLKRARFEEYLEQFGNQKIVENDLTYLQIRTLMQADFFSSIEALTTVNKILMEVSRVDNVADENAAVRALQHDAIGIDATDVKLEFVAKYQRGGMHKVSDFIRRYKDQSGVTKIVVQGKIGEIEKVINLEESQEKYKKSVEVDSNNQPMLTSVEEVLQRVALQRSTLRE